MSVLRMPSDDELARGRALAALRLDSDEAVRRAWDRLESDFGWSVAQRAWRDAAADLDREREPVVHYMSDELTPICWTATTHEPGGFTATPVVADVTCEACRRA